MRGILWFIFSYKDMESFSFVFLRLLFGVWVCFCLILGFWWQYAKIVSYYSGIWTWAQGKVFAAGTSYVKLLHFSVLDKVLWVKRFSLLNFKTCSYNGIICAYDIMFFSWRFNVLLPENYFFFREMVIRYANLSRKIR